MPSVRRAAAARRGVPVKGSLRVVVVAVLTVMLSAVVAPIAAATTWDINKPFGSVVGHLETSGTTLFVVTDKAGTKIGRVVKASSGGWKVVRGSRRIAVVKGGNARYPANLYNLKGTHIGKCGRTRNGWDLIEFEGIARVTVAQAKRACPARAALGAARLLAWD
jgi:hypothetical protein